jgi:hypothetical protein
MHDIMVKPLQAGVRLTAIFDSCHSETALELPYIYSTQGILKEPSLAMETDLGLHNPISSGSQDKPHDAEDNATIRINKVANEDGEYDDRSVTIKTSPADVIMFSGTS